MTKPNCSFITSFQATRAQVSLWLPIQVKVKLYERAKIKLFSLSLGGSTFKFVIPNTIAVFVSSQLRELDREMETEIETETEKTWAAKLWFTCKFWAKRKLYFSKTKDSNLNRCFLCCFEWCLAYLLLHFGSANSLRCEPSKSFSSYLSIVSDGTWSSACFFFVVFFSFVVSLSLSLLMKHNKAVTQISWSSDRSFCVSSRFVRCKCFLYSYKDNDQRRSMFAPTRLSLSFTPQTTTNNLYSKLIF